MTPLGVVEAQYHLSVVTLRVERGQTRRVLGERLRIGRDIAAKAQVANNFGGHRDWLSLFRAWRDETIAELKAAYEGTQIAIEFEVMTETREHSYARLTFEEVNKAALPQGIQTLENLIERLQLTLPDSQDVAGRTISNSVFSNEERAKLYYFVGQAFPKARLTKIGIARRYVGGEKQARLERTLREKLGRLDFEGNNVDEKLKNFILAATEIQLLGLLELMPEIESKARNDSTRGAALSRKIETFLKGVGIDSRFDDQGKLEHVVADTTPKALAELPDRNQLRSDIASGLVDRQPLALVFLDLDNFKSVNDTKGHPAGDKCLEKVTEIMSASAAYKGKTYRYGVGDELCVLLYNASAGEAGATAERIRSAIESARTGGEDIEVTASIGVAVSTEDGLSDPDALIKAADAALYQSKNGGKNRVSVWPFPAKVTADIAADARASAPGQAT
jgi:diguanylate cyclase (GGDEF)-like protein